MCSDNKLTNAIINQIPEKVIREIQARAIEYMISKVEISGLIYKRHANKYVKELRGEE